MGKTLQKSIGSLELKQENNKIVICSNTSWSIWNFRRGLIKALKNAGFKVYVIAPEDEYTSKIEPIIDGFFKVKNLVRAGVNPLKDLALFKEYVSIYKYLNPRLVINFTIKPNIYSSYAAIVCNIPAISTITGLGYVFVERPRLFAFVSLLYRMALKHCFTVFQNPDDMALFFKHSIVGKSFSLIRGSGVDTEFFPFSNLKKGKTFSFLFLGRLLKNKGVVEFMRAGKALGDKGFNAEFKLLGSLDKENPDCISEMELKRWTNEKGIVYHGHVDDVKSYIKEADCVVLASYYGEGVPKSLLEALSVGRIVIATDVPGCREAVLEGKNGFIVSPGDVESLVYAMQKIITLAPFKRRKMMLFARKLAEREFSDKIILKKYMDIIQKCIRT